MNILNDREFKKMLRLEKLKKEKAKTKKLEAETAILEAQRDQELAKAAKIRAETAKIEAETIQVEARTKALVETAKAQQATSKAQLAVEKAFSSGGSVFVDSSVASRSTPTPPFPSVSDAMGNLVRQPSFAQSEIFYSQDYRSQDHDVSIPLSESAPGGK